MEEPAFLTTEFRGMDRPAPIHILARNELVQHLMENHIFDNITWHKGLIQQRVDAVQPIALLIGTKAYGAALTLWRSATPGNLRLHTIDEVVLIELIINR